MDARFENVSKVPYGMRPSVLLALYFSMVALSGNLIAATETYKYLMRLRGVLGDGDQAQGLVDTTNLGLSASIASALLVGVLHDRAGPRAAAILGQLLSIFGNALIFFGPSNSFVSVAIGCCSLGATYSCISVAHTSIACLFPANATMAITIVCVAMDVSLAVPLVLSKMGDALGVQLTMGIYCALNAVIIVFEWLLVPAKAFCPLSLAASGMAPTPVDEDCASSSKRQSTEGQALIQRQQADDPLAWIKKAPLRSQILNYHFLAITLLTCFNTFRKTHIQQFFRPTTEYIAAVAGHSPEEGENMIEWFKMMLPFAFVFALANGAITNRFGVYFGSFMINLWGVILLLAASIPVLNLQWLTILFYDAFASFIFGLTYAYTGYHYGFQNIGVLCGVNKIFCGATVLLVSPWSRVVGTMPSILWSNRILLIVGIAWFAIPISMVTCPVRGAGRQKSSSPRASNLRQSVRMSMALNNGEMSGSVMANVARTSDAHQDSILEAAAPSGEAEASYSAV